MSYRRFSNYSKPTPRNITVKYAGTCASCGATITAGSIATFYPAGSVVANALGGKSCIAHVGGLDGNSLKCASILREKFVADSATNDYAGDGLDARYEDDCRNACGL